MIIKNSVVLFLILVSRYSSAQQIAIKYFHYNYNFIGVPTTNAMARFIESYNSFGDKPVGVNDYRIQTRPTITFGALIGFSYKGSRNLFTIPISLGETVLSSKGTDVPKLSTWVKNLDFSYAGIGVGYMGYLQVKKFKGDYHFPKVMYQFSLNVEKNSFLYTDKGGMRDRQNFYNPSIITFIQYNLYPPADAKTRVALGFNLKYHATLTPINLTFLQNDFGYNYDKSLMSRPSDISMGMSLIFLGRLNNRNIHQPEMCIINIVPEDVATKRKIIGRVDIRTDDGKKIKALHDQFKVKKRNQQFPVLFVKSRAKGYFAEEKVIALNETDQKVFRIPMKRIHPEIPLKTIYFSHATTKMADSSSVALETIYKTLLANPELNILIRGNTSAEGSARMNLKLSRRRAEFVKDFLVNQKIARHRIKTMGLGALDPILPDDTEQHRAQNRRAEVFILQ